MTLITRNIPPVEYIREEFLRLYRDRVFTLGKQKTVEICGLQFLADSPSLFGAPDLDYIEKEKQWYLSQSLNVNDIPKPVPKIWQEVSDDEGMINSNYGYLVFGVDNFSQFMFAMGELKRDPYSRRAVIQFNRPSMVHDYSSRGKNDYICTYAYQFFLRDDRLEMMVYMRSMDFIYGYPNDLAWAQHVMERMLAGLNKPKKRYEMGNIVWHSGSGHIYERHFYLLDHYAATGEWNVDKREVKHEQQKTELGPVLFEDAADGQGQGELPA
jgi:thymidylate synthase